MLLGTSPAMARLPPTLRICGTETCFEGLPYVGFRVANPEKEGLMCPAQWTSCRRRCS